MWAHPPVGQAVTSGQAPEAWLSSCDPPLCDRHHMQVSWDFEVPYIKEYQKSGFK